MSLATLLTAPTDQYSQGAFAFEHQMLHREVLSALPPIDRFSVVPYITNPQTNTGGWLMNHQQAHNDMRAYIPVMWGPIQVGTQEYGIDSTQNLQDVQMNDQGQLQWWTFVNSMDHMIAADLLPLEFPRAYPLPRGRLR